MDFGQKPAETADLTGSTESGSPFAMRMTRRGQTLATKGFKEVSHGETNDLDADCDGRLPRRARLREVPSDRNGDRARRCVSAAAGSRDDDRHKDGNVVVDAE